MVQRQATKGPANIVRQDRGKSDNTVRGELEMREDGTSEMGAGVRKIVIFSIIKKGLLV